MDGAVAGPVPEWFDSHCHIQEGYLPAEAAAGGPDDDALAATLARASAAGVARLVCVGTDAATSAQALALAHRQRSLPAAGCPTVWATVGLHPHEASAGTAEVVELAERTASDPVLVAVGECGLDYHYEHSPRPAQRRAFAEQIALAIRLDLALVVHAREAWDDLFDIFDAEGVPARTVLHCFTGGPDELRRCLERSLFVSFSGIVTFKNAAPVREAAAACPAERLLVETDSPFLAPVPHRGTQNEPAHVGLVGATVAGLRGSTVAEVARRSSAAAATAFGL